MDFYKNKIINRQSFNRTKQFSNIESYHSFFIINALTSKAYWWKCKVNFLSLLSFALTYTHYPGLEDDNIFKNILI